MKRELKFRVFRTFENEMFYSNIDQYISFNSDGSINNASGYGCCYDMQFTGLQDKNGVDIYEDDIIFDVSRDTGKKYRVYSVVGGFAIKEGYWNKDHSDLKPFDELILQPLADAQTQSWIKSCCEVIGNIHQNPVQS